MYRKALGFMLLFLCVFANHTNAQLRSHQIGRLWVTRFQVGSIPNYAPLQNQMTFPGADFFLHSQKTMQYIGHWIGVRNWTNKFGQFKPTYVSEGGYANFEASEILAPVRNRKLVRERLPLVDVNEQREQRILDNRSSSSRRSSLASDEQITTTWRTDVGIEVTRESYAFANPRHGDYIISEYVFQNTGNVDASAEIELPDQDLEAVYFGFWRVFVPSGDIGHEQMGGEYDEWCHYYGNQPGDSLRGFWYVYDGDNQRKAFDDIGDPSEVNGEFLASHYVGFGVLHADTDYQSEFDDRTQPSTVNYWSDSQVHSHTKGDPDATLYADLTSSVQSTGSDDGQS